MLGKAVKKEEEEEEEEREEAAETAALVGRICQFLWYKHFSSGQSQAANKISLNVNMKRTPKNLLLTAGRS